eukprot:TRINITY_DN21922_c0_g1_i2.p1 TRINITY_DN21922_c0_g1~~TRINITY_DN21922_c0_g1_i2.p1  ORF type:complete len:379 (+),score=120.08 TRINITY_DN21922_c0_g1_i2:147-1283(+)
MRSTGAAALCVFALGGWSAEALRVDDDVQQEIPNFKGDFDDQRLAKAAKRANDAREKNWTDFTGWSDNASSAADANNSSNGTAPPDPNEPPMNGGCFGEKSLDKDGHYEDPSSSMSYRRRRWPGGGVDWGTERVVENETTPPEPAESPETFGLRKHDAMEPPIQGKEQMGGLKSFVQSSTVQAASEPGAKKVDAAALAKDIYGKLDSNGDDALDASELSAFREGGAQAGSFPEDGDLPPLVRRTLGSQDLLTRFDKNHDGKLQLGELEGVVKATATALAVPKHSPCGSSKKAGSGAAALVDSDDTTAAQQQAPPCSASAADSPTESSVLPHPRSPKARRMNRAPPRAVKLKDILPQGSLNFSQVSAKAVQKAPVKSQR